MEKKSEKVVVQQEVNPVTPKAAEKQEVQAPEKTIAAEIWDDIKEAPMEMFSLPGQTVAQYFKPIAVEPSKLYLVGHVAAALPALEVALNELTELQKKFRRTVHQYRVDRTEKYTVVSYVTHV